MKKQILFVDDEKNVLDGLKRMLRSMRNEWGMDFAESGEDALQIMQKQKYDIIVSDMRMPGMDGVELLEIVQKEYPDTIRMVLSGHAELGAAIKAMGMVHQYMAKPCDPDTLKETISRTLILRNLLTNEDLVKRITKMNSLPSLPKLYSELNEELKCSEVSMNRISEIIEKDVGMTAKILQLVNSSFFGLPRKINDTDQAVRLLGIETIKTLVLSVHVFSEFDTSSLESFQMSTLWNHSLETGNLAKKICESETSDKITSENALLGGILHDCGSVILASNFEKDYKQVLNIRKLQNLSISDAERKVFGTTHAEVGAYVLGLWGMSDDIVEAVAFHHHPDKTETKSFKPLTTVHVADFFQNEIIGDFELDKGLALNEEYLCNIEKTDQVELWKDMANNFFNSRDQYE